LSIVFWTVCFHHKPSTTIRPKPWAIAVGGWYLACKEGCTDEGEMPRERIQN
jgi:hypothetical protein